MVRRGYDPAGRRYLTCPDQQGPGGRERYVALPFLIEALAMRPILIAMVLAFSGTVLAKSPQKMARSKAEAVTAAGVLLDAYIVALAAGDGAAVREYQTEQTRVLGTDPSEHWDRAELDVAIASMESAGAKWVGSSSDRMVFVGPSADVVWFEERITMTDPALGELRHTGVLVKEAGDWKLLHSVYSFPVPNERIGAVIELTADAMELRAKKAAAKLPAPEDARPPAEGDLPAPAPATEADAQSQ